MVLYSRDALARGLESAGFASVHIEESAETLRVFAARSAESLAGLRSADPASARALLPSRLLRSPGGERSAESAFACGFAYRHFKETNAGLYVRYHISRSRHSPLRTAFSSRGGLAETFRPPGRGLPLPYFRVASRSTADGRKTSGNDGEPTGGPRSRRSRHGSTADRDRSALRQSFRRGAS
jgi:hypothetical protein